MAPKLIAIVRYGRVRRIAWALPFFVIGICMVALMVAMLAYSTDVGHGGPTIKEYRAVLDTPSYWAVLRNTISISVSTATIVTIVSVIAVPVTMQLSKRVQRIMLVTVLVPLMIPTLVRATGWMMVMQDNGLFQWMLPATRPILQALIYDRGGVLIGLVHAFFPFGYLMAWAGYHSISSRQIEAAATLGASRAMVILRVILPQIVPAIVVTWVMIFLFSMGAYVTPTLLGGSRDIMIYSVIETRINRLLDLASACAFGVLVTIIVGFAIVVLEHVSKTHRRAGIGR